MKNRLRIANGQGFWGDSVDAPVNLIKYGNIDYLTLDYLAEVTMSIMQRQKIKNSKLGYAKDFVDLVNNHLSTIIDNNIKIITNAGGANPESCAKEIIKLSKLAGRKIKIAIIKGDDILDDIKHINTVNSLSNMDTGQSFSMIENHVCSANVYINSYTISEALSQDADIVLCGRVTDPGLALGAMIYEFGWKKNEYDKLASGTLAGHIIECGAQCTGGNHTRWHEIEDFNNIGYPIVDIGENGDFYITKPENSTGLINKYTVLEQVLYEMGDPKNYISPDVIVDFTSFQIDEKDEKVYISNVKGYEPTSTYKVSISYYKGYKATGQLTISGPQAIKKAKLTSNIIWNRLKLAGCKFNETNTEYLGLSSCFKDALQTPTDLNEVVIRLSVRDNNIDNINRFSKELAPVITNGPPGITGFSGGRPKAQNIIAYWPSLIDKKLVKTTVRIF